MHTNLSASSQDYLEAILEISKNKEKVRVTDIADRLKIKKASVTQALDLLLKEGLVIKEKYGPISLTKKGLNEAQKVKIKHSVLKEFFMKALGVPVQIANDDACQIEHGISNTTFLKLIEFINSNDLFDEKIDLLKIEDAINVINLKHVKKDAFASLVEVEHDDNKELILGNKYKIYLVDDEGYRIVDEKDKAVFIEIEEASDYWFKIV